jgi:hypothetical protein
VCSILTPLYSVIVLAVVVNRRAVHRTIRREQFFRWGGFVSAVTSILGIVVSVIGVQQGGLGGVFGFVNWTIFGVTLVGLTLTMFALLASSDIDEESLGDGPPTSMG